LVCLNYLRYPVSSEKLTSLETPGTHSHHPVS
jgi:hypothetical protein